MGSKTECRPRSGYVPVRAESKSFWEDGAILDVAIVTGTGTTSCQ